MHVAKTVVEPGAVTRDRSMDGHFEGDRLPTLFRIDLSLGIWQDILLDSTRVFGTQKEEETHEEW